MFVLGDLKWTLGIGNSNGVDVGLVQEKLFIVEMHFSSYFCVSHAKVHWRYGERSQGLRALAGLPEELSSDPRTHVWQFTMARNSSCRGSHDLLWPLCISEYTWQLVTHIYTDTTFFFLKRVHYKHQHIQHQSLPVNHHYTVLTAEEIEKKDKILIKRERRHGYSSCSKFCGYNVTTRGTWGLERT